MLNKLFCNHTYEYYHRGKYTPLFCVGALDKWYFICKKCGKTKVLYEEDMFNIDKKISEKVDREKALGIDNNKYENFKFILGCSIYYGKMAYYMQQKYKHFHQKEAIPYYS